MSNIVTPAAPIFITKNRNSSAIVPYDWQAGATIGQGCETPVAIYRFGGNYIRAD